MKSVLRSIPLSVLQASLPNWTIGKNARIPCHHAGEYGTALATDIRHSGFGKDRSGNLIIIWGMWMSVTSVRDVMRNYDIKEDKAVPVLLAP